MPSTPHTILQQQAYRPCPASIEAGYGYKRKGQTFGASLLLLVFIMRGGRPGWMDECVVCFP